MRRPSSKRTDEILGFDAPKASWGEGPWQREPDRADFVTKAGLHAVCLRHTFGSWCGYVAVPPAHPAHGMDPGAIDVRVHGGVTYAASGARDVYRTSPSGEEGSYWIGFRLRPPRRPSPGL